jgi:hypothetical protein
MARIGTVVRDVYRRPGADELPAHLEKQYGTRVKASTKLDVGVVKVDQHDGPPWVARLFVATRRVQRVEHDAEVLRFLERNESWPSATLILNPCRRSKVALC